MLAHISISNYAIVSRLEMEFSSGMTVVTGETGAGKSIMLDALGLCLGDRAGGNTVRPGSERAEVVAGFDIGDNPEARAWLEERELLTAGTEEEVILRRVVTAEGRSRAFINGSATTLQDLSALGERLIDIHSQHAHQSLLRREVQRTLLDNYAGCGEDQGKLAELARQWQTSHQELERLRAASDEQTARQQLLAYQVEELDMLALADGELETLEAEQNTLANAEQILGSAAQAKELCEEQEQALQQVLRLLDENTHTGNSANEARGLIDSAAIQLSEARNEIGRHLEAVEINPERLQEVQQRLEAIYDLARKHRVNPEQLLALHQSLREELESLSGGEERIQSLAQQLAKLAGEWSALADAVSKKRRKAAAGFSKKVSKQLEQLSMTNCRFDIALHPAGDGKPNPLGREDAELLISTNPSAPPLPLGKIASGGELSRISLAIQVVSSKLRVVPSMVFDEVDVGIGGATAEVVGRLLRELGDKCQVVCVTHLPQVAAQGHQHLLVSKTGNKKSVETRLTSLDKANREQEIARMLGGIKLTEQTLAHAREMIAASA